MAYFNNKRIAMFPRITVNNGLRLINKIELAGDASGFSVSVDADGKPFSCQTIYIAFDIKPDFDTATSRKMRLRVNTDNHSRYICYSYIDFDVRTSWVGATGIIKTDFIGGVTTSELRYNGYNKGAKLKGTSENAAICSISNAVNKPITNLDVFFQEPNKTEWALLKAGSKIEIWGCDYDNLS